MGAGSGDDEGISRDPSGGSVHAQLIHVPRCLNFLYRFRQAMPFLVGNASDINVHFGPCRSYCCNNRASSSLVQAAPSTRSGDNTSRHRLATCSAWRPGMLRADYQSLRAVALTQFVPLSSMQGERLLQKFILCRRPSPVFYTRVERLLPSFATVLYFRNGILTDLPYSCDRLQPAY